MPGAGDQATELVETTMTADSLQLTAYCPNENEIRIVEGALTAYGMRRG